MNKLGSAGIDTHDGHLVIDTKFSNKFNLHRNVEYEINNNTITVTGDKILYGVDLYKGGYALDEITEDSKELYKPWFWSKPRLRSSNIVEYLVADKRTYTSNNFTIIE